ncbi:MAG: DUF2339 domain-containing protein [Cytophagales bacterium]|nr:MAG: DUF2339 domain-containing protein [Cytophagales bacterium]TAF59932.1 MAG: DUF2339 domain-containing protein [Cytophagales bacterium]
MTPPKRSKESIADELNEFKEVVVKNRQSIQNQEDGFLTTQSDDSYQVLLSNGDFTKEDEELHKRAHLFEKKEEKETPQEEKPVAQKYADFKPRQVSLKAFLDLDEEIAQDVTEPSPMGSTPQATPQIRKRFEREVQTIIDRHKKDVETFIGENLMSKLGVLMLVIGISFGVNYGIATGFITEVGRLGIGVLTAIIAFFFAHQLRESNETFSSLLAVTGTIILYYTAFLFFGYYQIQNLLIAFSVCLAVVFVAVGLALYYDRKRLALFAMISGYLAGYLIDGSVTSYEFLFAYLLILNVAFIAIAYHRNWTGVNLITFFSSLFLYGGWLVTHDMTEDRAYQTAMIFSTLYYLTFFAMNVINSVRKNIDLSRFNHTMLLTNTFFYVASVLYVLIVRDNTRETIGIFAVCLGVFNAAYAYVLQSRKEEDSNLFMSVVSYTIFFVTAAIPLILGGRLLTIFWGLESAILLYLAIRSGAYRIKQAALVVLVLALLSLPVELILAYSNSLIVFFWNRAVFVMVFYVALMLSLLYMVKPLDPKKSIWIINPKGLRAIFTTITIFFIFFIGNFELSFHSESNFGNNNFRNLLICFYNTALCIGFWLLAQKRNMPRLQHNISYAMVALALMYFVLGHFSAVSLRNSYVLTFAQALENIDEVAVMSLANGYFWQFMFHYLILGSIVFCYIDLIRKIMNEHGKESVLFAFTAWFACVLLVICMTLELDHLAVIWYYEPGDTPSEIIKTSRLLGYTMLWTILSFGFMLQGMKFKIRELRLVSLTLFIITFLKFFAFDFRLMSTQGKIISFLAIGAIFITVSFLYNKLRKSNIEWEIEELKFGAQNKKKPNQAAPPAEENQEEPSGEGDNSEEDSTEPPTENKN